MANYKKLLYGTSASEEFLTPIPGETSGEIPKWIKGYLFRNGTGKFEVGDTVYQHWFDGLALLQKYEIKDGQVTYMHQFIKSNTYLANMKANRIVISEFGTVAFPDPCKSIFHRYFSLFFDATFTDNTSVTIFPIADELYAATETNFINRIDPETLDRIGSEDYSRYISVNMATAHAHYEADGTVHNMGSAFADSSGPHYCFITIPPHDPGESALQKAEIICKIPARWKWHPSYYHSFGMSKDHYVFVESPLVMDLKKLMFANMLRTPYKNSFKWEAGYSTMIHVLERKSGQVVGKYCADDFFTFHHINTYEEEDHLIFDCICYENGLEVVNDVQIENISSDFPNGQLTAASILKRFVIPLSVKPGDSGDDGENLVRLKDTNATAHYEASTGLIRCKPEILCEIPTELATINYLRYNGVKYRYIYGLNFSHSSTSIGILKIDCQLKREQHVWEELNCFATEPIFVPGPEANEEDDGVILSSVIRIVDGQRSQFLLVLDARNLKELGRSNFPSVSAPTNFHGLFMPK